MVRTDEAGGVAGGKQLTPPTGQPQQRQQQHTSHSQLAVSLSEAAGRLLRVVAGCWLLAMVAGVRLADLLWVGSASS